MESFAIDLVAGTLTHLSPAPGDDALRLISIENVLGSSGDDSITGTDDANIIMARGGEDTVRAGEGNDSLQGSDDVDFTRLFGEGGDDLLNARGGNGVYGGGDGIDTLLVTTISTGRGFTVNLETNRIDLDFSPFFASVFGVENVSGSANDDNITGDAIDNVLQGNTGDDTLTGNGGADSFVFDTGHGSDEITDFDTAENDALVLTAALAGTAATGADVIAQYATTATATLVVLDFGGSEIRISGSDLDTLADHIEIRDDMLLATEFGL